MGGSIFEGLTGIEDSAKKLAVIRAAVLHTGPTAAIDQRPSEIEQGYLADSRQ